MTNSGIRKYRIAAIPGDGIGREVVPEGIRAIEAAGRRFGFSAAFENFDWSCEGFLKTGRMMPEDGLAQLRPYDGIFLGAVGYPGVPDHISLWGLLIPIRRDFRQYVNLRPIRLLPGIEAAVRNVGRRAGIDFCVVRENNEGEYSNIGGRLYSGTEDELAMQQAVFTRRGCDRVMRFAFELAKTRKQHVTSATKSNGIIYTMPFWDERFAAMARDYPGDSHRPISHRYFDRAFREASGMVRCGGGLEFIRGYFCRTWARQWWGRLELRHRRI